MTNQPFGAHNIISKKVVHNYLDFISIEKILSGIDIYPSMKGGCVFFFEFRLSNTHSPLNINATKDLLYGNEGSIVVNNFLDNNAR